MILMIVWNGLYFYMSLEHIAPMAAQAVVAMPAHQELVQETDADSMLAAEFIAQALI